MGFKIGKVFKKVLKTAVKVAPYALAAAAVVYTGGAALGASWATGGFNTAVSGLVARTGASGALANILTGAVTKAGVGAAIGIGGAALTGQSITRGAQFGALSGAVVGGVMGAMQPVVKPAVGVTLPNNGPSTGLTNALSAPAGSPLQGGLIDDVSGAELNPQGGITQINPAAPAAGGSLNAAAPPGGWYNNPWAVAGGTAVGGALSGIGSGISGAAAAKSAKETVEDERATVAANYANPLGVGLLTPASLDYIQRQPVRQTPAERFAIARPGKTYKWNPVTGQIEETLIA